MKSLAINRNVDKCSVLIKSLLIDYNCCFYIDEDLGLCIYDKGNNQMSIIVEKKNLELF